MRKPRFVTSQCHLVHVHVGPLVSYSSEILQSFDFRTVYWYCVSCLKVASSANSLNGDRGKKRPTSAAANEIPQKKVKMEDEPDQSKVSFVLNNVVLNAYSVYCMLDFLACVQTSPISLLHAK